MAAGVWCWQRLDLEGSNWWSADVLGATVSAELGAFSFIYFPLFKARTSSQKVSLYLSSFSSNFTSMAAAVMEIWGAIPRWMEAMTGRLLLLFSSTALHNWIFLSFGFTVGFFYWMGFVVPWFASIFTYDCAIYWWKSPWVTPRRICFGGGSCIHYYSGLSWWPEFDLDPLLCYFCFWSCKNCF